MTSPHGQDLPIDCGNSSYPSLADLAFVFLKLGTIAFGGPAAHIAMMEDEFVRRRRWLSEDEFLDRLAMANLIPGPSSTELAIFIGFMKRGWAGLLIAGSCFIIPAALLVTAIAIFYVRYGSLPQVAGILYGIKPAVIAIILQALWALGSKAVKTSWLAAIGIAAALASAWGVPPLVVLLCSGISSATVLRIRRGGATALASISTGMGASFAATAVAAARIPVSLIRLFLSFFKIGSVVFGSGYVLLAFLQTEFIQRLHWLNEKQLIDAVAVGQFTPGPVFTTATFIGYVVAGVRGAMVATVGIFLPGFIFVAVAGKFISKIRASAMGMAILDGVVVGSLALMAVVAWQLGRAAVIDWSTLLILVISAVLLFRFRANSAWIICGAALVGWLARF